jgi:hypothetical protein
MTTTELTDEQAAALRDYESALKEVQKALVGKPGFGAEARYGETYQALVKLGLAPQIRPKYRAAGQ